MRVSIALNANHAILRPGDLINDAAVSEICIRESHKTNMESYLFITPLPANGTVFRITLNGSAAQGYVTRLPSYTRFHVRRFKIDGDMIITNPAF